MSATVRLLDPILIDQIAAGEVIERPANLVKELLENAIDARAGAITVSVEDGGRGVVRVIDDGVGMSPEDAAMCVERHATSKIATFDDLVRVSTLGFRGEALPSIGSVSKMTITTRLKGELEGTRVVVEGGELREVMPAGCPPGTTVVVEDLFYNVPARKKFLRARQTETSRIFEVCQRVALGHPELRLVVRSDGRTARQYLPAGSLAERAHQVFGELMLREIHAEREGLVIDALLAPVELARPGVRHLFLFVNGRPITDRGLSRAIAFAYGEELPRGYYPRGVVSLRLPPEEVDVNAHPQKTEVRFGKAAQVVDRVTRMLASRLTSGTGGDAYWDARMARSNASGRTPATAREPSAGGVAEPVEEYRAPSPNGLRFVAQVRERILICEAEDQLLVLDRHRADALVRYDALHEAIRQGSLAQQNLLFPDRIELEPTAEAVLAQHGPLVRALGFEWSGIGEGSLVVRAIPALLAGTRASTLFERAITTLGRRGAGSTDEVLFALADLAATPNGEVLDARAAEGIVAAVQPSRDEHRSCIVARVPLSSPSHEPTRG